jgi:hypothetical protein
MSALPPKADIARCHWHVRLVPKAAVSNRSKIAFLLDHLVGAGEQARRHFETNGLGGLEVDHELVLGRRLHRQVGRFLTLKDAVDIARKAPATPDV